MSVLLKTSPVPPPMVSFPDRRETTLSFEAVANPQDSAVTVDYRIRTPGVTFANGTVTERLDRHSVSVNGTTIPKTVKFFLAPDTKPPLTISVDAEVKEVNGTSRFGVGWVVQVELHAGDVEVATATAPDGEAGHT